MKKTVSSLIIASMLGATLLSGCGGNSGTNDGGKTQISVGNWPTTDAAYLELITRQKEEFENDNPDVEIVPDTWGFDLETFYSKAATNQLPTIYYANFTEIEKIKKGGYYTDISEGLKRAGYDGVYSENVLKLMQGDNGEIVTFPTNAYSLGMAINMDLFKKAGLVEADGTPMQPKNWDEVVEFGKQIKEKTGKIGFIIPTMNNFGGWLFTPIAWSYGVEFMKTDDGEKYTATFDSQNMIDALQYISDLKWKHDIFGDNALIDMDEYFKQLALGNVGMIIAAPDFTRNVYKYEMPLENIGMVAIPAGPAKHITLTGGYTATIANGATEEQVDAAIKWLEKVGSTFKISDDYRKNQEESLKIQQEENRAIGIDGLSVYSDDTELRKISRELMDQYATLDKNAVRLYNESLTDTSIEYKPEEPVYAQELYSMLDGLIQEVLTNKNADIPALVKKANTDFQNNYLNR